MRLFQTIARQQPQLLLWLAFVPLCVALAVYPLIFDSRPLMAVFDHTGGQVNGSALIGFALAGTLLGTVVGALAGVHVYQTTRSLRYLLARRDLARGDGDHNGSTDTRLTMREGSR